MRPGPAPARSARRETARSSVPVPAPDIQGPGRPVPGSLLATPLRTTAGTGSQRSETWTATATSARRPSGGQRIEGVAAIVIDGGRVGVRRPEQDDPPGPGGRRRGHGDRAPSVGGETTGVAKGGAEREIATAIRRRPGGLRQDVRVGARAWIGDDDHLGSVEQLD